MTHHLDRKSSGLAITSLVLGIVGLLLSWIPFVNYFAVVMGVVGLILGAIGIAKSNRIMSVFGTVLCVLTVVFSFIAFGSFLAAVSA